MDGKGNVVKLVEKPQDPSSNLAVVGTYFFARRAHEALECVRPSWRGEIEIIDAIQQIINLGCRICVVRFDSWWIDTSKSFADVKVLDERMRLEILGVEDSMVESKVSVWRGSRIVRNSGRNALKLNLGDYSEVEI